jgi:hypothetical protein
MQLFYKIPLSVSPIKIGYKTKLMSIGSCFSEHIAARLATSKFDIAFQAFGQLYNPISIANTLERIISRKIVLENELFLHNERYHSFDFHSDYSDTNKDLALDKMNNDVVKFHEHLKQTDILFITLGSAHVFEQKDGKVVANCHKLWASNFVHRRISTDETVEVLTKTLQQFTEFNPKIHVVFTVSPVRYAGVGMYENQLSKATLFLAIDKVFETYNNMSYFQAYEIVMDELRDYRFFKNDFMHPNDLAIDYVFERFKEYYFNQDTMSIYNEIQKILNAVMHKPFDPSSSAHKNFVKKIILDMEAIESKNLGINFNREKEVISNY